jgi:hypothetical protein
MKLSFINRGQNCQAVSWIRLTYLVQHILRVSEVEQSLLPATGLKHNMTMSVHSVI